MLDALPTSGRAAAIATVWALMTNDDVGELALDLAGRLEDPWKLVHDEGLANSSLHAAVTGLLDATAGWARSGDGPMATAVESWRESAASPDPDDVHDWLLKMAEPTEST